MSTLSHWDALQRDRLLEWINIQLAPKNIQIKELDTDLRDGLVLLHLLSLITGKPPPKHCAKPRFNMQKIDNVSVAIRFLEKELGKLVVPVNPQDFVDGNLKQIMGLLFFVIQRVEINLELDELSPDSTPLHSPRQSDLPKPKLQRAPSVRLHRSTVVRKSSVSSAASNKSAVAATSPPKKVSTTARKEEQETPNKEKEKPKAKKAKREKKKKEKKREKEKRKKRKDGKKKGKKEVKEVEVKEEEEPRKTSVSFGAVKEEEEEEEEEEPRKTSISFAPIKPEEEEEKEEAKPEYAPSVIDGITKFQALVRGVQRRRRWRRQSLYQRTKIAKEILSTEQSFVSNIGRLISVYMQPLKQAASAGPPMQILSSENIKHIFSQIEVIHAYNSQLLKRLEDRMDKWWQSRGTLGDIFLSMVAFLKVYTMYVNNYNQAFQTVSSLKATNPRFVEFLKVARRDTGLGGLDINSLLIMPIQRLPRYVLLLTDLLKHTDEAHPDHKSLVEAASKVREVAGYVNERKREAENLNQVAAIAERVQHPKLGVLAKPSRRYLRQGMLFDGQEKFKERYVFLFNDLLVVTQPSGSAKHRLTHVSNASHSMGNDDDRSSAAPGEVSAPRPTGGGGGSEDVAADLSVLLPAGVNFKYTYHIDLVGGSVLMDDGSVIGGGGGSSNTGSVDLSSSDMDSAPPSARGSTSSLLPPAVNGLDASSLSGGGSVRSLRGKKRVGTVRLNNAQKREFTFHLFAGNRLYTFATSKLMDKMSWMATIDDALSQLLQQARSRVEKTVLDEFFDNTELSAMETVDLTDCRRDGWLQKKSSSGGWSLRYFVLKNGVLFYKRDNTGLADGTATIGRRKKKGPKGAKLVGFIRTLDATVRLASSVMDKSFALQVETPARIYFLAAQNNEELYDWIGQIRSDIYDQLKLLTNQNSSSKPSLQLNLSPRRTTDGGGSCSSTGTTPRSARRMLRSPRGGGGSGSSSLKIHPLLKPFRDAAKSNRKCADCKTSLNPGCAVSLFNSAQHKNYLIFVCAQCGDIHQRVDRSRVVLRCESPGWAEVDLSDVECGSGNDAVSSTFASPPDYVQEPKPNSSFSVKMQWILSKYTVPDTPRDASETESPRSPRGVTSSSSSSRRPHTRYEGLLMRKRSSGKGWVTNHFRLRVSRVAARLEYFRVDKKDGAVATKRSGTISLDMCSVKKVYRVRHGEKYSVLQLQTPTRVYYLRDDREASGAGEEEEDPLSLWLRHLKRAIRKLNK